MPTQPSQRLTVTYLVHQPTAVGQPMMVTEKVESFNSYGMNYNGLFLGIKLSPDEPGSEPAFVLLPIGSIARIDIEAAPTHGPDTTDTYKRLFG